MTPQEKAIKLVKMIFTNVNQLHTMKNTRSFNHLQFKMIDDISKKIAINLVDEIIKYAKTFGDVTQQDIEYFEQVKEEINNL